MTTRQDVLIWADGEQIAAYVYHPQDSDGQAPISPPCIVMAHGFSGTRDDGLPACPRAFCEAGHT